MNIQTHDFEPSIDPIQLKAIRHNNHYDFTEIHRHNYFEVMFFYKGGGKNLIDFVEYDVKSNGCYIIFPDQIHLLNREPCSYGNLIQFQWSSITSPNLQRILQERSWLDVGAVLFEDELLMAKFNGLIDVLRAYSESDSIFKNEIMQHLLHSLLFDLCSITDDKNNGKSMESDIYNFQRLIEKHYKEEQTVGYYMKQLGLSEKKLASISKSHMGISPLQIIHKRILLEAKRQLAFGEKVHKEIAYDLGFDSPASFSAFIKKKTGLTASEIQTTMSKIHK